MMMMWTMDAMMKMLKNMNQQRRLVGKTDCVRKMKLPPSLKEMGKNHLSLLKKRNESMMNFLPFLLMVDEHLALPSHGSEVFIGGLPQDASKDDLRELYSRNFGGRNCLCISLWYQKLWCLASGREKLRSLSKKFICWYFVGSNNERQG